MHQAPKLDNQTGQLIKSGCYAAGQDAQNPIELPLKSFYYDIEIVDSIAEVKMVQNYYNDRDTVLDVEFVFPIPPDAAISRLEYELNGNMNRAVIVQKEEAQQKYGQGLNEGRGVIYGGIFSNSKDYMKIKVGNILQNKEIKIYLSFVQKVSLVYNTFYEFRLQTSMTPRYGARLNPNEIVFEQPNYKTKSIMPAKCTWGIKLRIKSSKKIAKAESLTHQIVQNKMGSNQSEILIKDKNIMPNKDFALLYTFENFQQPSYSICHNDNKSTAVVSFIPKYCQLSVDDALNQAKNKQNLKVGLNACRGEYIFLLDRSGSMEGIRIERAKMSLIIFLKSLPEDSYFNIVSFGSKYKYLFQQRVDDKMQGKSLKYTKESLQKAINGINKMTADLGGTQILNPIMNTMTIDEIKGYPRLVFLLTDGGINDVTKVLKFIKGHTQYSRVSTIGIGNGCSKDLIENSAKMGKGYSAIISDEEEPASKIISLLENSLTPIIVDLKITFDKDKVESISPNPQKMPYILKNDLANFYITFNGKLKEEFEINISYRDSLGASYTNKVIINPNTNIQAPFINTMVAYENISALVQTFTMQEASQERIFFVKNIDMKGLKEQIIKKSIENQILTELTAFVCIDQSLSDEYAKQVAKLQKHSVSVRSMIPYDHVEVTFVQEEQGDVNQDDYIDECCMNEYELANEENLTTKMKGQILKQYRPMKMYAKTAFDQTKPFSFSRNAITKWKSPQKRQIFNTITSKQEINGSWTQDFTESLQNTEERGKKTMFNRFKRQGLQDNVILTIIVYGHLSRVYDTFLQYKMIAQKAKNYITNHSRLSWPRIMEIYNEFYNLIA